jgi:transketolase
MSNIERLIEIKKECMMTMLSMYKKADAGHIGASLSSLDILIYLFFKRMNIEDKFILSKGHAAAALYTVLAKAGKIPEKELETFYADGTNLAAHPPCSKKLDGILFGTGSLGHGLSLASGIALASRFTNEKYGVYCVVSDGDLNEGATWEAIMFAAHNLINNLTVIIDSNGLQGFGKSSEVMNLEPIADKFRDFGFSVVHAANGNDFNSLDDAFIRLDGEKSVKPSCIIAKTVKGSGISFMENKMEWHYLPMSDEQYKKAIDEAGGKNA